MTSLAHEGRDFARSPRLGWGAALTAAFLGWVLAGFAVALLGIVAWELGLVGRSSGSAIRDWPYPEAGWPSLLANTIVWLWIFAATALLVRGLLADRSERPVSAATVFVILLATGFAPVPHGLLELPWLVGLILTAALLRLAPGAGPDPLPKRTTAKLIAVATSLLLIPAAHGLLHPLWPGSSIIGEGPSTATFSLRNAGFAKVELEAVSLQTQIPFVELIGVRVDDQPPFLLRPASFGLPFELASRSEAFVQLQLRHRGCGEGRLPGSKAKLRYRVYGVRRTETLPVSIASRSC
jgi:hypothetical protein